MVVVDGQPLATSRSSKPNHATAAAMPMNKVDVPDFTWKRRPVYQQNFVASSGQ